MLVVAVMILLAVVATVAALITASPLYRTLVMAFDCWAEAPRMPGGHSRY